MLKVSEMTLDQLIAEADSVDKFFNPTKGMTALERHVFEQGMIGAEMYAGQESEFNEDPFDRLAREEEEMLAYTGHNLNNQY